jgi:signal transduction histidine kinase
VLGALALLAVNGVALFAIAQAKNRIIQGQQRALEEEQRLRRAQEAFSDNAHHELKTPLQIITGDLYLLRLLDPTPEQTKVLERAEAASRRLEALVHDLLEFTAIHHGELVLHPELMDLGSHLQGLAAEFQTRAEAKGLAFHADLSPLPAPFTCDWTRLRRALAALLENALRFTAEGSIHFILKAEREESRTRLRFEIRDTGMGLPADWRHLLKPFEQGEVPVHRAQEGLGIGLPLAAGIIRQLGGQMGLEPQGTGTLAWVEFAQPEASLGA